MNNTYLAAVCHDVKQNTLEATFITEIYEGEELVELRRTKCQNYSKEQKAEFLEACGEDGQKYVDMAGW